MTHRALTVWVLTFVVSGLTALTAEGQTLTYHAHQEASSEVGLLQLRSSGPDTVAKTWSAVPYLGATSFVRAFNLPADTPSLGGVIPKGTAFTFTLWMRITENRGTVYPAASMTVNFAGHGPSQLLCSVRGTSPLTTTLTPYTLGCTVSSAIPVLASDRLTFYPEFYTSVYTPKNGKNGTMSIELGGEGTLNGMADSRVVMNVPPAPRITGVSPLLGPAGTSVTVSGANFGGAQGSSTVTLGGVQVAPTAWSDSSISFMAPVSVAHGPVDVVVNGQRSNAWMFLGTWDTSQCQPQASTQTMAFDDAGEALSIGVTAGPGCNWTVNAPQGWFAVSPTAGTGNGSISVTAVNNSSTAARTSGFSINGIPIAVLQAGTLGAPYFIIKALQPPSLSVASGIATCTLTVSRPNETATPLFVAMDLYGDGQLLGTAWTAGASFQLQVARSVATSTVRCVAYSVLNGFVVSETPP